MSEENKLVPMALDRGLQLANLEEVQRAGKMFLLSGMFAEKNGDQDLARACVKIIAGQELGLKPFQAMRGIDIIKGNPSYRYQLVAAKVKQSGRYDFRPLECDEKVARIQFFDRGQPVFISEYTIEQAKRANLLSNPSWQNHPGDMLYARAMTKGVNKVCPEIFFGECEITEEVTEVEHRVIDESKNQIAEPTVRAVATEMPKTRSKKNSTTTEAPTQTAPTPTVTTAVTITEDEALRAEEERLQGEEERMVKVEQAVELEPVAKERKPLW